MAALPTATGESSPGAPLDSTHRLGRDDHDVQLATLRSLLVGPLARELDSLRQRVAELEDADHQTTRLAERLPQALALHPTTQKEMAAALSPLIKTVLWETRLREAAGGTLRSRLAGMAGAVLGRFCPRPEIMRLRLIHRARHALVEEYIGTFEDPQARAAHSMLDLLQEKLRDPEILAGYDVAQSIHADNITYGIHVGPLAILLSAIRGRRPQPLLAHCKTSLDKIHQLHAVALAVFDPAEPWQQILSGETSVFEQTNGAAAAG
jgi:hypothetical protein